MIAECDLCEAVLRTVGALVVVLDAEGRILRFNRACESLTGYRSEEIQGRVTSDFLIPVEEAESWKRSFRGLVSAGSSDEVEETWVACDGKRRRIAWTRTVLAGPDAATSFVGATGIDVTERNRIEERLRLSERLESVGRLAGGVAHEFNNILSAILGYGSLILKSLDPEDALRRDVEEIQRAADRGADLVRQLVAFSRSQALKPQLLDLNDLVAELGPMLGRLVGENVRLLSFPSPDLGRVHVDPGQLKQVLINLVLNAREAMPRTGFLTIKTRSAEVGLVGGEYQEGLKPGRYVVLSVIDTGKGIANEDLPRIFDPFFTTGEGRSGLGLAMAHGFVLQSGGDIVVETELGRGTRFDVYLPEAAPAGRPAVTRRRAPSEWGGEETILLVEDDPYVRTMTRRTFEEVGYHVIEAVSGEEAFELHRTTPSPVDLLLTDVVLPGMSGPDLAALLRARGDGARVLYMTGHDETTPGRRGLPADVEVLSKPFDPDSLLRRVREALDSRIRE